MPQARDYTGSSQIIFASTNQPIMYIVHVYLDSLISYIKGDTENLGAKQRKKITEHANWDHILNKHGA